MLTSFSRNRPASEPAGLLKINIDCSFLSEIPLWLLKPTIVESHGNHREIQSIFPDTENREIREKSGNFMWPRNINVISCFPTYSKHLVNHKTFR